MRGGGSIMMRMLDTRITTRPAIQILHPRSFCWSRDTWMFATGTLTDIKRSFYFSACAACCTAAQVDAWVCAAIPAGIRKLRALSVELGKLGTPRTAAPGFKS